MDCVNRILWLKCRLASRAHLRSTTNLVGMVAIILFSFLSLLPAAVALYGFLVGELDDRACEMTHMVLTGMYFSWATMSGMGYLVTEFFDLSRLHVYPQSSRHILLGAVLSNFLDPASLCIYPFLGAVALASIQGPLGLLVALAGLACLSLHMFAIVQLAVLVLTSVLQRRRVLEVLLLVVPPLIVVAMPITQIMAAPDLKVALELAGLPISTYTSFLPPGIAANMLVAIRAGAIGAALWHLAVLAAVAALSIVVAGSLSESILTQAPAVERVAGALARTSERLAALLARPRAAGRPGRLWALLSRLIPDRQVLGVVVKELRQLPREPQLRLITAMYIVFATAFVVACRLPGSAADRQGILIAMDTASVFMFSGIALNCLAVERDGLRFLLACPVPAGVLLVGKSVALWCLLTIVSTATVALFGHVTGASTSMQALLWLAGQVMLVALLGVGNVTSVLTPTRWPSRGSEMRGRSSTGRIFAMGILGAIGTAIASVVTSVALVLLFWSWVGFRHEMLASNLVMTLLVTLGAYAALTALGARILEARREDVLRELTE